VKEVDATPGLETMVQLSNRKAARTRPPPREEVELAITRFFMAKHQKSESLADHEAAAAHLAIQHLQTGTGNGKDILSADTLMQALKASVREPKKQHAKLAQTVFDELERLVQAGKTSLQYEHWQLLIQVLSKTSNAKKAWKFLQDSLEKDPNYLPDSEWRVLMQGLLEEDAEKELLQVMNFQHDLAAKRNEETAMQPYIDQTKSYIIQFYSTQKEDLEKAKKWYIDAKDMGAKLDEAHVRSVLLLAVNKNDLQWAKKMIDSVIVANPGLRLWDIVFLWAAALGRGVEEIDRMMQVMERRTPDSEKKAGIMRRPDAKTINSLVELANSKNDPYLAERFIQLGHKWDVRPDAQTYMLQMKYRLSVNDIDGATASYKALQAEEVENDEDLPLLNALIRAMCSSNRYPVDHVMVYVQDLNDRRARFEPETVAALSILHLSRDELHDLIDLLHTHTIHYSMTDRAKIKDVLIDFCLRNKSDIGIMWDTYVILTKTFPETDRATRTKIMNEFFAQNRSDLAYYTFENMRQHSNENTRANLNTWAELFAGIADTKDEETLETAHNQFKMDLETEADTRLRNSLMMAYTACGMARKALVFWNEIVESREGPNFSSIHLAFRACELAAWGEETAKQIWKRLRNMDIEITPDIFASYVGALAGNGLFDEVQQLIQGCEKVFGYAPNVFM